MSKTVRVEDQANTRLDIFLSEKLDISRSYVKTLIEDKLILVNGKVVKAGYGIKIGDEIEYEIPAPKELDVTPSDIEIDIVYEDEDMAVINKAQGMVVHPAPGSYDNTLVNALLYHLSSLSNINGVIRPGIVHRLDKDTSGLLVVAKNDDAHINLQQQISTKSAKRYYIALVDGNLKKDEGVIHTYIDRSSKDRKMMAVSRDNKGREAITLYKVIQRYVGYTLVEYELKTGRTHQIRVHSKHLGHPIVGDRVYGGSNKFGVDGQLLHAFKLVLNHPRNGREMTFQADLPDYFKNVLGQLKKLD